MSDAETLGSSQNRVPCRSSGCPVLRLRLWRRSENQAYPDNREFTGRCADEPHRDDRRIRYGELRHREFRDYPEWGRSNPRCSLRGTAQNQLEASMTSKTLPVT